MLSHTKYRKHATKWFNLFAMTSVGQIALWRFDQSTHSHNKTTDTNVILNKRAFKNFFVWIWIANEIRRYRMSCLIRLALLECVCVLILFFLNEIPSKKPWRCLRRDVHMESEHNERAINKSFKRKITNEEKHICPHLMQISLWNRCDAAFIVSKCACSLCNEALMQSMDAIN